MKSVSFTEKKRGISGAWRAKCCPVQSENAPMIVRSWRLNFRTKATTYSQRHEETTTANLVYQLFVWQLAVYVDCGVGECVEDFFQSRDGLASGVFGRWRFGFPIWRQSLTNAEPLR